MKKTFLLKGLDCPNCAAKIERAVSAIDGVQEASVSFITTKMILEADETKMEDIMKKIKKAVKRADSDVTVQEA